VVDRHHADVDQLAREERVIHRHQEIGRGPSLARGALLSEMDSSGWPTPAKPIEGASTPMHLGAELVFGPAAGRRR
jgi:hypothetical protein